MTGETGVISIPGESTINDYGETVPGEPTDVTVRNLIIGPATTTDMTATQHPEGVTVDANMFIPRSEPWRPLRGATVKTGDGSTWRVVGDPRPTVTNLTPTDYWPVSIQLHKEEG